MSQGKLKKKFEPDSYRIVPSAVQEFKEISAHSFFASDLTFEIEKKYSNFRPLKMPTTEVPCPYSSRYFTKFSGNGTRRQK